MNARKGIILAGGTGSRLHPATQALSKHLLMVYNKPMIYYPLSVLMLAGIREILLISTPEELPRFRQLFGDGSQLGITLDYAVQSHPAGLPEALIIGRRFLSGSPSALILGDNIFFGTNLTTFLSEANLAGRGSTIFSYQVPDPQRYGVVECDSSGHIVSLEEKPTHPRSHRAVTGLYFYDDRASDFSSQLRPSARGELEIMDLNRLYWSAGDLTVKHFGRGIAWLDSGTFDSLLDASTFIATIERRQGVMVACLEEIAWHQGWIGTDDLERLGAAMQNSPYGRYLLSLAAGSI